MSILLKTQELTTVEWKVVDIFSGASEENFKCFVSPTFTFADTTWRLLLAGKLMSNPQTTSLILMRNEHRSCALEYTFGLKKLDGTVEQLDIGVMKQDQKRSEYRFIKLTEVLERREEMAPFNSITLTCSLNFEPYGSYSKESRRKRLRKLDTLSQNFKDLFTNKLNSDIVIKVKDKTFQAHAAVLIARSKVFAAMFQHETIEKETGIINIADCDPDSFEAFLQFLYCGVIDDVTTPIAHNLFQTAEKYGIIELKAFCLEHLKENITIENWCDILILADIYSEEVLFNAAQKFFNRNLNIIFKSLDWESLLKENCTLANKLLKDLPNITVHDE